MASIYAGLWVATPCNTFSPLREKQPGPRVLRTKEHIQGLPKSELTQAEQKQLKESNILVDRSSKACQAQRSRNRPWGLENPDHPDDKPAIWLTPAIRELALLDDTELIGFDQCTTGLDTRKLRPPSSCPRGWTSRSSEINDATMRRWSASQLQARSIGRLTSQQYRDGR